MSFSPRTESGQFTLSLAVTAADPGADEAAAMEARTAELRRREAALPQRAPRAPKRVLSYGGGLDSFWMLLFSGPYDLVIFADVTDKARQDPGEWPETYSHIERVVIPYCRARGIPFVWLTTEDSPVRGHQSLYAYLRSLNAMVGRMSRMCTVAAKVERVAAYVEALWPTGPIEVAIGFEAGEEARAAKDPHAVGARKRGGKPCRRTSRFPMIERGVCRCKALAEIRAAGYEPPPGSACTFCPFGSRGDFQRLDRQEPGTFVAVTALEAGAKRTKSGATIRYAGGAEDPVLAEWIQGTYKPRTMACEVCGRAEKVRKNVGCSPAEMAER